MSESLTRKKKTRGGHRASAQRTIRQVYEAIESTDDVGTVCDKLEQHKMVLQEKLDTVKQLDADILELVVEDDLEEEIGTADEFKEKVYKAMFDCTRTIEVNRGVKSPVGAPQASKTAVSRTTSPTAPSRDIPPTSSGSDVHVEPDKERISKVKLPKLTPRKFNGELTKWLTFWDSFESSIHNNRELSDIDRFNYLHSLLEGPALEAISGLKLTTANYSAAIAILQKRFGNRQQIITKHMDILLNLEPVLSQFDLKGIRHLYDVVESQVRSLKSLGVAAESYGSLLTSVLINKLPQELKLIVSRQVTEDMWNLDDLMGIMEKEITARERAAGPSRTSRKTPKDVPTATALLSSNSMVPKCSYCRQAHPSSSCKSVTSQAERKQILRRTGRCFVCLRKNHTSRECRSNVRCGKCGGRHHISICFDSHPVAPVATTLSKGDHSHGSVQGQQQPTLLNPASSFQQQPTTQTSANSSPAANSLPVTNVTVPTSSSMCCFNMRTPVLLQTARTSVYNLGNPENSKEVRILFDTGSQRSYITESVKKHLNLNAVSTETMIIKTFGMEGEGQQVCDVVKVGMNLKNRQTVDLLFLSVPLICEPISNQPTTFVYSKYNHLASLDLADCCNGGKSLEIDILIGADQYYQLVTGEVLHERNGLTAIHTRLGWVFSGPVSGMSQQDISTNLVITHALFVDAYQPQESLDHCLKQFWDLESMGIQPRECSVYDKFENGIAYDGERYQVSLPWKESHPPLPDNYDLALRRLNGLLRRLRQSPGILHQYNDVIQDQIRKGIVEAVVEPRERGARQVHYLPHHAVLREDKETTKLRVVYDASAKINGPALNDCLYAGPKFGQKIMDIVMRFRVHKIAVAADIEKAFLMIVVAPDDRDVLRFLWVDDVNTQVPNVVVFRFTRVVFGVSSSPFLLNATIRHHMERYAASYPEFVEKFLRSIYVDDVSYGADDPDSAYELYERSKQTLAEGGFNLRKFVSNSTLLSQRIQQKELERLNRDSDSVHSNDLNSGRQDSEQKVLGIRWNFVQDELIFDLNQLAILVKKIEPTKRQIVAITTKFYDPLGFISPIVIRFKVLFQAMCVNKIGWDDPLTGELLSQWRSLVSNFHGVVTSIPRCYFVLSERSMSSYSLQGFCDASSGAYAAVVYLRISSESGNTVNFVASKTRVAPTSKQTIPRLELLSALLLSNLIDSVSDALKPELELKDSCCYTDSRVALYWIKGIGKEWKPFVENRVNEIRRLVPPQHWSHCPGRENPADLPSRGMTTTELAGSRIWRYGPDWLIDSLPSQIEDDDIPDECWREVKTGTHVLFTVDRSRSLGNVICCENYSSLSRLLRVTAYVLRFIDKLKSKVKRLNMTGMATQLTAEEISKAERLWIVEIQKSLLEEPGFQSWKQQFRLFLEDGVWRCKGRLDNADIPYASRHPALLPKNHHVTSLIVWDCHNKVMHNGVKETLCELRARYWIVKGRQLVRRMLYACTVCRRFEGQSYNMPPPPPLPSFRVTEEHAFSYTGVDFAGPLYIKVPGLSTLAKVWICLYTCCAVRAVHLDLVPDLSCESFIRSFKRFTARRGFPRKIISDNGKTFKSAAKRIANVLNHPEILQYFAGLGMQWSFNLEKAPWWGGIFERMVKSVKRCLRKTIGRASLTHDELMTALTEVEVVVNSRPLSYVSTEDTEEPLTPSHLLIGRRVLSLPDATLHREVDEDVEFTPRALTRRMDHLNKTLDHFWRRWKTEYLLELRESHRYGPKTDLRGASLSEGDVVLMHSDSKLRGFWKLVRIQKLIKGHDSQVRGAVVRVPANNGKTKLLRRPLKSLYPLECANTNSITEEPREVSGMSATVEKPVMNDDKCEEIRGSTRPVRRAALRANRFIDAVMGDNLENSD